MKISLCLIWTAIIGVSSAFSADLVFFSSDNRLYGCSNPVMAQSRRLAVPVAVSS